MGLFNRVFGSAGKFEKAVADYPVFAFPHRGLGNDLSPEQRQANLAQFEAVKDQRIALLQGLLGEFATVLPAPNLVGPGSDISLSLDRFGKSTLAHVKGMETICAPKWRERAPAGREAAILSVVVDIGIYCGECTTNTPPGFRWTVDNSKYRKNDYMPTSGNVCIAKVVSGSPKPFEKYLDILDWSVNTVALLAKAESGKTVAKINAFDFLDGILEGGHG